MMDYEEIKERLLRQQLKDETKPCTKCEGCGYVADTPEQEPWTQWMNLPLKSSIAVIMGLVKRIECPRCNETGYEPDA